MNTGLFAQELDVIKVSADQFQAACKEALRMVEEIIAAKGDIAPKDHPLWHGFPFGDVSFAHEISRGVAKAQGRLQDSPPDCAIAPTGAILDILVNACMWQAWRSMQAATERALEPVSEQPEEVAGPEPEPEPEAKPKRRLSLRRPS